MQTERIVRLFRNGRNQALRIPRDLELPGNEALLHKEGNRLLDSNSMSDLIRHPGGKVTDNVDEFARVPGLSMENWLAA